LDQKHEYGSVDDMMDILKILQKGNDMNILERLYIYKTAKYKPIMNGQFVKNSKVLFNLVIDKDMGRSNSRNVGTTDHQ
jgi:hypothetical protein